MRFVHCFFLLICILFLRAEVVLAARSLPDDNLSYPVIIDLFVGGEFKEAGSGFFLNASNSTYLITAKHVLFNKDNKGFFVKDKSGAEILISPKALISAYPKDISIDESIEIELDLEKLWGNSSILSHQTQDVVAIKIGPHINNNALKLVEGAVVKRMPSTSGIVGISLEAIAEFKDVLVGNDVFVFGYPVSLRGENVKEINFRKPLLRKGIVAGKDSDTKSIIIDCFINKGNSGGLVVEADPEGLGHKFRGIGIILKFVPFQEALVSLQYGYINHQIENSGYSIVLPMDYILDLIKD